MFPPSLAISTPNQTAALSSPKICYSKNQVSRYDRPHHILLGREVKQAVEWSFGG